MTHMEMAQRLMDALSVEHPIAIYYADEKPEGAFEWNCKGEHFCHIGRLASVRQGTPMVVDRDNPGCGGAAFFLGWKQDMQSGFEHFLSHNSEGNGERFKKTPELVREMMKTRRFVPATGRYCIFKRLADLDETITPEVIAVFAEPDQLGALVFLANYDRPGGDAVVSPFSSGCGSLVTEPRAEANEPQPRAVIGMFDPTVRPRTEPGLLSFAVPFKRLVELVENIPGSFLEIEPWTKLRNRQ